MAVLDSFRLDGKVALVTGCGRGIGRAMALALAGAGADIAGLYHTRYQETEAAVQELGRRFLPIQCDLAQADDETARTLVDQVHQELGHLDILVNNAGIVRRGTALELSETDWHDVLQVNLTALFLLSQAVARRIVEQGRQGKIINVASVLTFQGGILVPAYTAAKHGVAGLTKALATEWAAQGINVNAIAPGYIHTDNTAPLQQDDARYQAIRARIPAGRWGEPDDLAGATVFLAASASDYMHGSIVAVDGGWLVR